jgi:outer membrane protein
MNYRPILANFFAVWVCIAGGGSLLAQEKPITLHEAVDLSLKNSKQLRISKAKIEEASAAAKQAIQGQLPDLKVSGAYDRVTQPTISIGKELSASGSSGGGSSGGGSSGGSGSGTSGGGSSGSTSELSNIKVNQAIYGIANLSLPLFSGFRIHYGIESAKYLEKAAMLDADNDREEVILNTINAYANLYKAHANVMLLQENLAQSMKRDSDFMNMESNGLLARNDLLKARLQTSTIEYNLADAENNEKIATVNMNLLLGLPEQTVLATDSASLTSSPQLESIEAYEKEAIGHRTDLGALQYQRKAAGVAIQSAKADYFPSIALTGGYIAADIPNLFSVTNAITYGVGLQYNIGSFWKTGAKVEQAKAKEREVAANEDLLDDNIRLQVNQAYGDYLTALKKIDVSRVAIAQGEENYKINRNKYNNQLVTMTDLLEANVTLLQAKINMEMARADAVVAYNTILERVGALSDK